MMDYAEASVAEGRFPRERVPSWRGDEEEGTAEAEGLDEEEDPGDPEVPELEEPVSRPKPTPRMRRAQADDVIGSEAAKVRVDKDKGKGKATTWGKGAATDQEDLSDEDPAALGQKRVHQSDSPTRNSLIVKRLQTGRVAKLDLGDQEVREDDSVDEDSIPQLRGVVRRLSLLSWIVDDDSSSFVDVAGRGRKIRKASSVPARRSGIVIAPDSISGASSAGSSVVVVALRSQTGGWECGRPSSIARGGLLFELQRLRRSRVPIVG